MANNKIILGDETLIDLTEDTVTEDTLLEGETAHDASGAPIVGRARQGAFSWEELEGKPFNEIGADFKVEEEVLALGDSVRTELDGLRTDIDLNTAKLSENADWLKSDNLFNKYGLIKGKHLYQGIEVNNADCGYIKIPINGGETYTISGTKWDTTADVDAFFDASGGIIRYFNCRASKPYTVEAPQNAKYLSISCWVSSGTKKDDDTIKVEVGNSATAYTLYSKSNSEITEELATKWVIPDADRRKELPYLKTNNGTYTAEENGVIHVVCETSATKGAFCNAQLLVTETNFADRQLITNPSTDGGYGFRLTVPIKKGHEAKISFSNATVKTVYLYY